ncbi:MAG TPA: hypothetical protein VHZ73_11855 [Vicinamibacterales bacterium]|jgi:hypothetical protein|nr:hypothetical protein [Vicinamibacterales bacterium]
MLKRVCGAILACAIATGFAGCTNMNSPSVDYQTNDGTVFPQIPALTGCGSSASPLPGSKNCTGSIQVTVPKPVTTGVISVYFNYPDSGSFYHGQVSVGSGAPGTVTVPLVNEYISTCLTSYATRIDVYDGPQTGPSTLIGSRLVTLTPSCS